MRIKKEIYNRIPTSIRSISTVYMYCKEKPGRVYCRSG